jgi:serine/threonine-protein kinase
VDAQAQSTSLEPGTLLAERYRIESLLGEGGMGAVYRAEHVHMHKAVAIKVLHPSMTSSPEVLARFEREAVAAAKIDHPNVAHATDFGRLPDGSFYLVLEHVPGESLRDVVGRGRLEPRRALGIARQIALAIGAAHAKGIVHRDLKPENVMLVQRDGAPDFVKVLDFGIAKVEPTEGDASARPLTRVGAVMGTPDYMPPEQALGQKVDLRADLYALGVILYELLAGRRPFEGGVVTVMREHVTAPVPPLPEEILPNVDARAQGLIRELMAKSPESRPQSAEEVVARIDEILSSASPAPPISARILPSTGAERTDVRAATMLAAEPPLPASFVPTRSALSPGARKWAIVGAASAGALILVSVVVGLARSPRAGGRAGHVEANTVTSKDTYAPERAHARPSGSGQSADQGRAGAQKKCNTRLPVLGCID